MPTALSIHFGAGSARVALVLLLFAAGAWMAVRARARRAGDPSGARLLLPLRLLTLAVVALLLLDLTLVVERTRAVRPRVVVAVDRSLSMTLPAEGESASGESRLARAARVLASSGLLDRLRSDADVEYVAFAGRPRRVSGDSLFGGGPGPVAGRTDLARVLDWVPAHVPDADAVVVVTDGRVNAGDDPGAAMHGLPRVLFVGVGRTESRTDADLSALRAPGTVHEGSPVPFEVTLRTAGDMRDSLRLIVVEGGRTIRTVPVEPGGREGFRDVRFSLSGETPGPHEYEIRVDGAVGDAFPGNDRRTAVVEVSAARSAALVVSGAPRWDLTFFIDALSRLDYLRVDRLLLEPGGETGRLLPADGAPAGTVPIDRIDPGRYALLCFQGGPLPTRLLPSSLSAAARAGAPWRAVFLLLTDPVRPVPGSGAALPPWLPAALGEEERFREGVFEIVRPAAGGLRLPAGRASWESLPPLDVAVDLPAGAVGGEPLVRVREDQRRFPAVARETRGAIRIVSLFGRGYWRWAFHRSPFEDAGRLYPNLIDALVRWALGGGPDAGAIRLTPAASLFERGETVEFLRSGTGRPEGRIFVAITPEGGEAPPDSFFFDPAPGDEGRLSTRPFPPGGWRYAYGVRGEAAAGQGRFTVGAYSREFSDPEPDERRLAALGAAEGAAYVDISDLSGTLARTVLSPDDSHGVESTRHVMTHSPIAYVLVLIFLISEIVVRKRHGLS